MKMTKVTTAFLQDMGIPCTKKERDAMPERELSEKFSDLNRMRQKEYEKLCEEFDTNGICDDTLHETLVAACKWVGGGIVAH